MKILVTGSKGSIGTALCARLEDDGHQLYGFDLPFDDVRSKMMVGQAVREFRPELIFHLAASKSAPDGEIDPYGIAETNVVGTMNVLDAARVNDGVRVIFASTCKAADPETAYGASKLLCERMVLAQAGTVCRFFNVREASGNVFRLWESLPADEPIPVTSCRRFFMSLNRAVELLVAAMGLPAGRYTVEPGVPRLMRDVANDLYPDRELSLIPPRRGDRNAEPLKAASEHAVEICDGLLRIESEHEAA